MTLLLGSIAGELTKAYNNYTLISSPAMDCYESIINFCNVPANM